MQPTKYQQVTSALYYNTPLDFSIDVLEDRIACTKQQFGLARKYQHFHICLTMAEQIEELELLLLAKKRGQDCDPDL